MTPQQVRQAAGLTQIQAAVYAGVSPPTLRLYERAPDLPAEIQRRRLDAYYQRLAAQLAARSAEPQPPQAALRTAALAPLPPRQPDQGPRQREAKASTKQRP